MPANPQAIAHYRNLREQANASIPSEAGPARAAAANPPVPKAWVNAGDMDLFVEQRPDGVFVTGKRLPDGTSTTFPAVPAAGVVGLPATVNATTEGAEPTVSWADMQAAEGPPGPTVAAAILSDIQHAIPEMPRAIEYGLEQAAQMTGETFMMAGNWLEEQFPTGITQQFFNKDGEWDPAYGGPADATMPDISPTAPPETVTANLVSGIAQFLAPFGVLGKMGKVAGITRAPGVAGAMSQGAGYGMLADFVAWEPHEAKFADLVQSVPWAANPITEWLASPSEDGNELYDKLKMSVDGAIFGSAFEGILRGLVAASKVIKQGRITRSLLGEEGLAKLKATLSEFAADETGTVKTSEFGGGRDAADGAGSPGGGRGGATIAGGAGAAVLAGSAGQDALASEGDAGLQTYFDDEGIERDVATGAIVITVRPPMPLNDIGGAPDAARGEPAVEEFQVAGRSTQVLEDLYKRLGWIPPTIDESAGRVIGGTITDETFDALRSSLGSPSMDDIDVALGSFPYASLTKTGQIDDFFAAVTDAFSQQIGDVTGAAPRAAIAGMRDEVTALQNQLADLTAGPLASADVKGMTQVQRDLLEIDLVRRIEDLEQRIARSGRAEQGVMTDDTVAWLANATGLTEDQLLNRATGEAYNAPQLRAARAIVEGSLDQVRSIHAETLLNPTTENLALLRRQAQITSALLLQFKGAVAEAGRALGSLRANAAMPPDMPAGAMPPNDLMRAVMLADYVETTGGEEVNKRFLAMMTEALKEPNSSLLADYTRRASGASTMDMLVEAWINSLLGSPTTHAVNFIGNSALTTSLLTERWLAPFIPTGNTTGPRRTFGSSAAYTFALMSSFREALQLAFRAGTSNSYSSKFTTATRGSALTIENIAQLRNRDTGNYLSDLFDRSVGTVLEDAGLLLPRGTLEQGGLTAYLADGLFEYYHRGPSRVLASADEFFKVINYRAAVAEYAYMQATAEGLTGQAFKDRVDAIMASPDTLAPDIHLGAIEHSRYATLQMDSTPVMRSMAMLRSNVAGGKIVVPFLNVIANIIRVGAHRMPVAGLAMPDNIARLQTGNAADRQEVVSRQVMGGMLLMSGAMLAANGCITGRLTDNYEQREALATEGIQPYSFNMGCFGGEDGHFISYARTEPMSSFLAMSADVSQMLAYTDKEQDATMIAAAALSSVANYTMDQSFLQGVVTVLNAATPNSRDMEAGLDKAGRVGTEMAVGLLMGTFGPAGPGSPLMANLNRTFGDGDVRRDTRPDPMGNYLERQLESVLNRYRSRTLGLSDDVTILDWEFDALPVRYNWLGKPMPYDAFGPDVLSPFPQMQAEHDAAFLVDELGLDPERAATLDLTGMRVGPDNEIPLSKWGGYVDAVGISGEFIRLGLIPPSVPGRLLGVELTPTQQSLFAYLRGQGTYIRGDGGATYAVDPDGNTVRTVVGSSGLGASGLYPNLEPGEFYNMEEALNAVIASEWYALKSDYTDSNLGSGADTKKEVLSEIISLYTSGANVGGTARTALFNLFPDLASDVLERRHNVPPELLPPDMLDAILNSGVTP